MRPDLRLSINFDREELDIGVAYFIGDTPKATRLDECIWNGPTFMKSKVQLKQHYGNSILGPLFQVFLQVPDYTIDDLTHELCYRYLSPHIYKDWSEVYKFIHENITLDSDWQKIRFVFGYSLSKA